MFPWVLILTLVAGWDGGAISVTTAEFANKDACLAAANVWLKQMETARPAYHRGPIARAACVEKS